MPMPICSSHMTALAEILYPPILEFPLTLSSVPLPPSTKPNCRIAKTKPLLGFAGGSLKWRAGVSFFSGFSTKKKDADVLKEELFEAIKPLDRGAEATPEEQERVDQVN